MFDPKKVDGFGLNPYDGSGNTRTLYYGEAFLRSSVRLAPNAVVIVNHACYSAGSSEPGRLSIDSSPATSVFCRMQPRRAPGPCLEGRHGAIGP